jgi:hypothetical protein
MDAWDQAQESFEQHRAAGGRFLKLNDGDRVVGCFVGDPLVRRLVWNGSAYERYDEDNPAQKGKRPTMRMAVNFYVPSEGAMKVIDLNAMATEDVLKLRVKRPFNAWLFEIERDGKPGDTKSRLRIMADDTISPELRAEIAQADQHDLKALLDKDDEDDAGGGADDDRRASSHRAPADAAIDVDIAAELTSELKKLGPDAGRAFVKKFSIARVRDVKTGDLKAARAFIQSLQPKSADSEVDPFA